ncbi:MAG: ribonuclease Z [Chitinophagales bacterium]|nr:ribonuclease Z [Chitinophagales bacterium]
MNFSVKILGINAALPTIENITSAQLINKNHHLYLIDCGEGTQVKMLQHQIKKNKIRVIFISHLHGDHIFGLPGLLTSFLYSQRKTPLKIIGPPGIREYIETVLRLSASYILYDILIDEIEDISTPIYQDENIVVHAIPLHHRIQTFGYIIREVPKYSILPEMIEKYKLTYEEIQTLKQGASIRSGKDRLSPEDDNILIQHPIRSYAYCSDTIYDESLPNRIKDIDTLYHESTYLHALKQQANERMHCTAHDAALTAKNAGVKKLILGHFSTRYHDLNLLLDEAKSVFEHVIIAREGLEIEI